MPKNNPGWERVSMGNELSEGEGELSEIRSGGREVWCWSSKPRGAGNDTDEGWECAARDRGEDGEWSFMTESKQMWALALPKVWQLDIACNISPKAKLSVLVIIHLLQRFQLDSPRLLNHPQPHLEVINSYINLSDAGLSLFQCVFGWHEESFVLCLSVRNVHQKC